MSPDAPLQLTRELGFHPRTSALTRNFGEYRGFWVPHCFSNGGAIDEYWACREKAVIMDLSPLRKLEVLGPDAEQFLQGIVTRNVRKLAVGQIFYTAMCYEHGGMVDDGTLFRLGDNNFRWIGGDDASLMWLKEQAAKSSYNVNLKTATSEIHNVAVQGPLSREILSRSSRRRPDGRRCRSSACFASRSAVSAAIAGIPVLVSRTGYTGELGFEVFCHPKNAPAVWDAIMTAGAPFGLKPFGFDALDMVRIEAGPRLRRPRFRFHDGPARSRHRFHRAAEEGRGLHRQGSDREPARNPLRKLVGLEIAGNEKPSHGDPVFVGRAQVGVVTSAMRSPLLKKTLALARVDVVHVGDRRIARDRQAGWEAETPRRDGRAVSFLRSGKEARPHVAACTHYLQCFHSSVPRVLPA